MTRTITGLALLLLIQIAALLIHYWSDAGSRGSPVQLPLLHTDGSEIIDIEISDNDAHTARLKRTGTRWTLPGTGNLPADPVRIRHLLERIYGSPRGFPVGRSAAARQRFEVADYLYRRRIVVHTSTQTNRTVYLGTSPGYRKVYARSKGAENIYSVQLNVFDAPATDDGWLDARLLQIRTPLRIDADTYSLHRDGADWLAGNGRPPDKNELLLLLTTLRTLRVQRVADADTAAALFRTEAERMLTVEALAATVELQLFTHAGSYFVRSSEYPFFFQVNAADARRLINIDAARIAAQPAH